MSSPRLRSARDHARPEPRAPRRGLGLGLIILSSLPVPARGEPATRPTAVVVVKRGGVTAYEEVAEEFAERCRVRARVVSFGDEGTSATRARIGSHDLVVTIGQEALDAMSALRSRVIPTLAFHAPAGLLGPPAAPAPELILRVLATAGTGLKRVGTVYGPRSEVLAHAAARAAEQLGLVLTARPVRSGPEAVRALRALVEHVDALWLPGDIDVITPQVFQYALRLQLERGLPLAAATRQQVHSGALLAVDFDPRGAGRAAAEVANRYLRGDLQPDPAQVELHGGARITVNRTVGRRLGAALEALTRLGARLE